MSLASHDSAPKFQNGFKKELKVKTEESKKSKFKTSAEDFNKPEDIITIEKISEESLKKENYKKATVEICTKNHLDIKDDNINQTKLIVQQNYTEASNNDFDIPEDNDEIQCSNACNHKDKNNTKYLNKSAEITWNKDLDKSSDTIVFTNEFIEVSLETNNNHDFEKNYTENFTHNSKQVNKTRTIEHSKNKKWQKQNKKPVWMNHALKRRQVEKYRSKSKWRSNSVVLLSLMMLNVAGLSSAVDTSSFSSALTSRMIATFLGYPSTCTLGTEVRPCTLTLSCWLRGGTRVRGCGGWLFSCCGMPDQTRETFDNSIPSSEWKYKPPTKLRQVPQRSVLPNNVFRRRADDDVTQMECGLPSSKILQKRIIGGREARFAEFPWQAHVRISEFQCGGVLVSHRFVATAAHCVSRAHTRDIVVWLGAIDTSATHHPARKLGVIQKILHPLFQYRMTQPDRYDIALLKLSRPVAYMSHILPICLPDQDLDLRGRSGVIAGWGKTDASSGHTGTNLLRSAAVPILSKEQCINWHQSKQISVEIHSEMICAGHSDGHQDACLGDSGGPLIVLDSGRYYLIGITSAGFGCGVDHQPGIYHNVKLTANWIRNVISPVSYNDNYIN